MRTQKEFATSDNDRWTLGTRPIVEAFFHARFFLEMAVRYAMLEAPPRPLPSGYAALLYLYQAGGSLRPSSGPPHHHDLYGLTPQQFDAILSLAEPNPVPKPDRWKPL